MKRDTPTDVRISRKLRQYSPMYTTLNEMAKVFPQRYDHYMGLAARLKKRLQRELEPYREYIQRKYS